MATSSSSGSSSNSNSISRPSHKRRMTSKSKNDEEEEALLEPGWACTACTYRNEPEAFKCLICDTRKGTSTRKPRLNPVVVQQQTLAQTLAHHQTVIERKHRSGDGVSCDSPELSLPSNSSTSQKEKREKSSNGQSSQESRARGLPLLIPFADALVVRSTARKRPITVNGKTFVITEYKPRISTRGRKKLGASTKEESPHSLTPTNS